MDPYRTPCPPQPETSVAVADDDDGRRLAFGGLTFVGAVQVVIALPSSGPPALQTLFGAACFIAGASWLLRQR